MKNLKKILKRGTALALAVMMTVGFMPTQSEEVSFAKDAPKLSSVSSNDNERTYSFKSKKEIKKQNKKAESLPSKYDLRDVNGKNYVTQVKFQNPFTSCWSFAAIGACEESWLYENGITNEQYKEINNGKELNLSEKAVVWYLFHGITKEDVCDDVPASQVGEGADFSELEKENINAAYGTGGSLFFVSNLFSSGFGPKSEDMRFKGEDNEYPYAYWGKNKWTEWDTFCNETIREKAEDYMRNMYMASGREPQTEEGFQAWFAELKKTYEEKGNGDGGPYCAVDDWTIPVDHEHRTDVNFAALQESHVLPSPAKHDENEVFTDYDEAGINAIKSEVYKGRAVSIGYKSDQSRPGQTIGKYPFINTETWAHYTYRPDVPASHAVTIVGYDDNYSSENFLTGKDKDGYDRNPQKNGAFICKNSWGSVNDETEGKHNYKDWGINGSGYFSWGEGSGQGGCFYLSYYDKSIQLPESFDFYTDKDADAPKSNQYYLSQYDFLPCEKVQSVNIKEESSMANVFTAQHDQKLSYFSTQTGTPNAEVNYEIYKLNDNYANPKDGQLLESGTSVCDYGGYHRIALKDEHPLAKGEKFSVVVTQKVPDDSTASKYSYEILFNKADRVLEADDGKATLKGVVNKGESYACYGGEWEDWTVLISLVDAEAKARGKDFVYDNPSIKAYSIPLSSNTIKITHDGKTKNVTTKAASFKIAKKKVNKKAQSFTVSRKGKGKISISKKSSKKLNKYFALKGTKVVVKKNAPKGKYKFTVTVAKNSGYKKTTSKVVTISVL